MSKKIKVKVGKGKLLVKKPKLLKKGLRAPAPVPPPHPSGMAQPPMSKADERRREVASHFFYIAEVEQTTQKALDELPKNTSVKLSKGGELLINGHSREEFHARGCPIIDDYGDLFRDDGRYTRIDGTVGEGDMDGGWYFEGTVKDAEGDTKYEIEFYYPGKNKKKKEFTVTKINDEVKMSKAHKDALQTALEEQVIVNYL